MAPAVERSVARFVLLIIVSQLAYGHYVADQWAYDVVDQNASEDVQVQLPSTSSIPYPDQISPTNTNAPQSVVSDDSVGKQQKNNEGVELINWDKMFSHTDVIANEPLAIKEKVSCLGCATEVDIDISPENREAVENLGEEIVKTMDRMYVGPFIHARPQILNVQKQVERGVKYIVTFESHLSFCLKGDTKKRKECAPQEESRICVAEVLRKDSQPDEIIFNNCTDIAYPMNSVPNSIPVMKLNNEVLTMYENLPLEQDGSVIQISSQDSLSDDSQESHSSVEGRHSYGEIENSRSKRWTNVGALKDVGNDEKDLVSQFAQLAVKTLDEVDPDNSKRIVLRVVEAKKQIVNGVMYHLVLHVATSDCPEEDSSHENSDLNCLEDKLHPEKICRVQIHRSWAGESPNNAKVVKSECADLWLDGVPPGESASARSGRSRQSQSSWASADDWETYDMQDTSLQGCLHEAIDSLHNILLVDDVSKVATIMDAHTRVNQETTQPELAVTVLLANPKKLKVTEDIEKPVMIAYRSSCHRRHKRAPEGIPGGLNDADVNSEDTKRLITFGLSQIEKSLNSNSPLTITRVIKAQKQVVAGTLLHLEVEVSPTSCLKSVSPQVDCPPVPSNEHSQICRLKIWDRPWLNKTEITTLECDTPVSRAKREILLGGPTALDVTHPDVKELAMFALADISKELNSLQSLKIVRILEAKKQIVSGTLTHLKIEVTSSGCQTSNTEKSDLCTSSGNQELVVCSFSVYEQSWTNTKEVQKIQCGPSRSKRDVLVGAPEAADPEDAYVKELAEFAVLELDKKTNSPYQQKVLRITEAKKQIVAGVLMHLKMELGMSSCRKGESGLDGCIVNSEEKQVCSLKVLDQKWTGKREVQDVQCGTVRARRSLQNNRDVAYQSSSLEVDKKDPYIIDSAWYAVAEMDKGINSPFHRVLDQIIHASVEHAELTTIKLHLKVSVSSCRKNPSCTSSLCKRPKKDSPDCPARDDFNKYMCYVEIQDRPWLKQRVMKSSTCSDFADETTQGHHNLLGGDNHDIHAGLFREFMHRFNKTYPSDSEMKARFHIFRENLKLMKELQAVEQGTAVYGPTMFADLSPFEFKQKYLGLRVDLHQENAIPMPIAEIPNIELPEAFDWRDHNAVTPVKNQGACGSCWAFAVTGNLEGQYAIKKGKLLSLSEQELVDCDKLDSGCNGGLFETAYHSIEQLGGLETESDYPYEGYNDECHFNRSEVQVRLSSSVNITSNETDMAKWLVKNGPIAIAINANAMQFYVGGVSHPFKFLCSPSNLDHGVLIVGYGVHTYPKFKKVLPYWIIKNSWGERWGEQGYYRVYRGDGTCGVNQMASSGIIS